MLLCSMEQEEIKSWSETAKIDRVCRAHAQIRSTAQNIAEKGQDKSYGGKVTTCVFYKKGRCTHKQTHETKGVLYKHVCMACWAKEGKSYPYQLNVIKVQKTSNPGHDPGFESCP